MNRSLLRFLTCGSVDDGKSTFIGRLLYDCQLVANDQLASLARDTRKHGTTGEKFDFALLVDGLEAEREQGITIDVAYRFFATPKRSFIVADAPGHEQYTRNMATGASNSDAAVLLIDARSGALTQTRRHAFICSLLGIRHIILAINKLDLVAFSQAIFDRIVAEFAAFSASLRFHSVTPVPISARFGDNVVARSSRTPWYAGPTIVEHLEVLDVESDAAAKPFRFPVQRVSRPNLDFRGLAGTIASGTLRQGEAVVVAGSDRKSHVARIVTADGDLEEAAAGQAVTLTLTDAIDVARGDVLSRPDDRPTVADQFAAHLLWMNEEALLPGRQYLMRLGTAWTTATVTAIKHKVDINTLQRLAGRTLELNEIGLCNLSAADPLAFDPYEENRATGSFILIDRLSNQTAAAGMIQFGLRRAANIPQELLAVDRDERAALKGQRPAVLWFTGLSGSGKSTIAKALELRLHRMGRHTYMLDGDNLRHGINRDLGFSDADRVENIRRAGEIARLMTDAGLIVLCSFISPFRAERRMVRDLVGKDAFVEVFVDTPIEECMRRDPKGLYAKARAGTLKNFTGFDSAYERPEQADVVLETIDQPVAVLVERLVDHMSNAGLLD